MVKLIAFLAVLLVPSSNFSQEVRTPLEVSHTGGDPIGLRFKEALNAELSRSTRYRPVQTKGDETKFEFLIDLNTVDVSNSNAAQGKKSVVSIVIEQFRLPNSYPVPTMWYHKVVVVERNSVDALAKDLLFDMDARWCVYIKNSVGRCPKQKFYPVY